MIPACDELGCGSMEPSISGVLAHEAASPMLGNMTPRHPQAPDAATRCHPPRLQMRWCLLMLNESLLVLIGVTMNSVEGPTGDRGCCGGPIAVCCAPAAAIGILFVLFRSVVVSMDAT